MAPSLPAELIHRIILLSLPSTISFEALPDRYTILLSYALVCKAWAPSAQLELYRHVLLAGDETVARFIASTEGTGSRLAGQVASMRVSGGGAITDIAGLDEVLKQCTSSVDLRLKDLGVSLATLGSAPFHTQLHLRNVQVDCTKRVAPFMLPRLAWLSIVDVVVKPRDAWTHLLKPSSLTTLSAISVALSLGYVNRYSPSISALAQALSSLTQLTTIHRLPNLSLARGIMDDGLDLPLRSALEHLPTSLQQLRLIPPPLSNECELDRLGTQLVELQSFLTISPAPASLQSLQRLVLPDDIYLCSTCKEIGERRKFTAVQERCAQLGINIAYELGEGGGEGEFAGWESYLDDA